MAEIWQAAGHDVEVVTAVPDPAPPAGSYRITREWTRTALTAAVARANVVVTNGYSRVAAAMAALNRRRLIVFHQGYQLICSDGLGFRGRTFHGFRPLADLKLAFADGLKTGAHAVMRIPFDRAVQAWTHGLQHVVPSRHVARRLGLRECRVIYQPPNPLVMEALTELGPMTSEARASAYETGNLVFFGRLVFEKGCEDLIKAYALWRDRDCARAIDSGRPRPRLIIYGQGPEQAALEGLIHNLGLGQVVEIRPFLKGQSLAEAARVATAVVVPSRWEEPGATIAVELFACGAAVIASETGAQGEIFSGHGRLFPNGNIERLAEALEDHFRSGGIYPKPRGDEPWLVPRIRRALLDVIEQETAPWV